MSDDESNNNNNNNNSNKKNSYTTTTTTTTTTNPLIHKEIVNDVMYEYMVGYGNELCSEVIPGALPIGRNNPRIVPYNLYTEQLSGTAFTTNRYDCRRTWCYRIQPSVVVSTTTTINNEKEEETGATSTTNTTSDDDDDDDDNISNKEQNVRLKQIFGKYKLSDCVPVVDAVRWNPIIKPTCTTTNNDTNVNTNDNNESTNNEIDFIDGIELVCGAGEPSTKYGIAIYQYQFNTSMSKTNRNFVNADGDFLFVPCNNYYYNNNNNNNEGNCGIMEIITEFGILTCQSCEIVVIPRGMVFQINNITPNIYCTGYVLEIYSINQFQLPELGPIGSNGLANPRDFYYPTLSSSCNFNDKITYKTTNHIYTKMHNELFHKVIDHTPYNIIAWHGNYLPYKYNLNNFCIINSVSYDHIDPSIYTVLTCPSGHNAGTALADFVIFSPRILATDTNTLRPPWFHKNTMSEYMGLIYGTYDAKTSNNNNNNNNNDNKSNIGFVPGSASLHNCMTPHGPDTTSYMNAINDPCTQPTKFNGGIAFMFETCLSLKIVPSLQRRDMNYPTTCWQGLHANSFTGWDLLLLPKESKFK